MAKVEQLHALSLPAAEAMARLRPPRGRRREVFALTSIGIGFLVLFAVVSWDRWRPAVAVSGVRAVTMRVAAGEEVALGEGKALFQASGWIEPAPYPIKVASFVPGVVAEVRVLDGQYVSRGEVLVSLDDRNLKLALAEAEAEVAELTASQAVLGERIGEAERQIDLAGERLATAEAELSRLQRQAEILQRAGEAIPLIQREDARLAVERQRNAVREAVRERELREAMLRVAQAEAEAQRHKVAARQAGLARLQLDLERTIIRAPICGIVQRVLVRVGQMVNPDSDEPDGAVIAAMYDPARLQVRVDVALADAGGLVVGMSARATTEALPGVTLVGEVSSLAGQADLAKNTIQAKVKLLEPPAALRPEMLARVEFLPRPELVAGEKQAVAQPLRVLVPEAAVLARDGDGARIWVAGREGTTAEFRAVVLGNYRVAGWCEIREGIGPGEILITSSQDRLKPGSRVRVALVPPPETIPGRGTGS